MFIKKTTAYFFIIAIATSAFFPMPVAAQVMSSENYQMKTNAVAPDVLQYQNSGNYIIKYPWQNTRTSSSASGGGASGSAVPGGGGALGSIAYIPSRVEAFNTPLIITEEQSGILTYTFPKGMSVVVDAPKGVAKRGLTIFIEAEKISVSNKYLIPRKNNLVGGIFWNIMARDSNGAPVKKFDRYITIKLPIPNVFSGNGELGVYWLDESAGSWVRVNNAVFDSRNASFKVDHLTKFAIFSFDEKLNNNQSVAREETIKHLPEAVKIEDFVGEDVKKSDILAPESTGNAEKIGRMSGVAENQDEKSENKENSVEGEKLSVSGQLAYFFVLIFILYILLRGTNFRKQNSGN